MTILSRAKFICPNCQSDNCGCRVSYEDTDGMIESIGQVKCNDCGTEYPVDDKVRELVYGQVMRQIPRINKAAEESMAASAVYELKHFNQDHFNLYEYRNGTMDADIVKELESKSAKWFIDAIFKMHSKMLSHCHFLEIGSEDIDDIAIEWHKDHSERGGCK